MNLYKKDYSKLYLWQNKFLSWWIAFGLPFYLTGGTVWLNKPLDKEIFEQQLRRIADDFMLGNNNSLGINKTRIENAKIIS
jgi:hypothetical protein